VFGALCHQRGITPLHASAIDLANGCVAFVGASGAGKSTLVAALAQRGHEVISDDECFLQLDTGGDAQAWPGISRIWLWDDSMTALGFDGAGVERELHRYKKYFVPVRSPRNPTQSRPLRRVYQLNRVPHGVAEITRLRGADAVEVLMQNVYPPRLAHQQCYQSHVFRVCAATARDVPVFRLDRPWNFASFNQGIDLLENHLRDTS
jgi:energy-coupling factor transporter ATP-binding protein EcfA2